MVCLAERGAVTLWDARARAPSAQARAQPSPQGLLHCVAALGPCGGGSGGLAVACAGDDRVVYVLDPRMGLKVTKRWKAPCKYGITSLHAAAGGEGIPVGDVNHRRTFSLD